MKAKKIITACLCALMIFVCGASRAVLAAEDASSAPIYAGDLSSGTYTIDVTSSASMFKIVDCQLTVSGSDMSAVMTLSGKGYEKLFMGTGEQALEADESSYIYFVENAEGKYTYTVPVAALNQEIDCAAFSFKKQKWYDRVLVFESESLPESAFAPAPEEKADSLFTPGTVILTIGAGILAAAAVCGLAVLLSKKRKAAK